MNYRILEKIRDELVKEKPDLSYIRGMIETLISLSQKDDVTLKTLKPNYNFINPVSVEPTELPGGRSANLQSIKEIINASVKTEN